MAEGYEPRPFANYIERSLTKTDTSNYIENIYASRVIKYNDIKILTVAVDISCPAFSSYYELFSAPSDCIPITYPCSTMLITKKFNHIQLSINTDGKVRIVYNPTLSNDLISGYLIYI